MHKQRATVHINNRQPANKGNCISLKDKAISKPSTGQHQQINYFNHPNPNAYILPRYPEDKQPKQDYDNSPASTPLEIGSSPTLFQQPQKLRDDANRVNAGSILFDALILFRPANGKQLSFVGILAEWPILVESMMHCLPEVAAFGCCPAAGGVGFGPMLQDAFLVLMPLAGEGFAGVGGVTHDASLWICFGRTWQGAAGWMPELVESWMCPGHCYGAAPE
ncbi:hypothetical protein Nepgr_021678 [Nepenthes gracilis]|uniref:Uncharacterized protein n=1 Tax=Nepenthes gracilis TaxID=150966 RepID=A0AAD3SZ72_NEPGR|nr:hypothetical protein Nepgr_021678 [Nepenthes gracilis]